MAFADGLQIWAIEGVRVDEQIVLRPETQTPEQILGEPNEEVKRIRIARYGWLKLLAETDAQVMDSRDNPIENTKEMLCRLSDQTVLITHCPSQGKIFALEVPPEIKTCDNAQTWLHTGSRIDALIPHIRTIGRS